MVKKKPSINQNFEALKAQMQAKRKLAENKFEQEKETIQTPLYVASITNLKKSEQKSDEEEYITLNIVDDEDFKENLNSNEDTINEILNAQKVELVAATPIDQKIGSIKELQEEQPIIEEIPKMHSVDIQTNRLSDNEAKSIITPNVKKSDVADISMNKIIIKKIEKQEAPKRITYYLKPETIKKIDKFSKATGMGKSEFVQTILDEILNNLEVEK